MVRSLQARILSEEWEKREELEKLQVEQRKLLDMERNKTKTFAQRHAEMERQLEGKLKTKHCCKSSSPPSTSTTTSSSSSSNNSCSRSRRRNNNADTTNSNNSPRPTYS